MLPLAMVTVLGSALHLAASVAAILVGRSVSVWLIAPLLVVFNFGALAVFTRIKARMAIPVREADDLISFRICSTGLLGFQRRLMGRFPRGPRCRFCHAPFGGLGPLLGSRPSGKNPNYCESCFDTLPSRSTEARVAVLFADIRGFTRWADDHAPAEAAALLTGFYDVANRALTSDDAFVEFVGDQVMAFYLTDMPSLGKRTATIALDGARRLIRAIRGAESAMPVGVGLGIGTAEIGAFMKGGARDFTVIGDLVNTTARLQGVAEPFQIVMSEPFYRGVAERAAGAVRTVLELKGKADPVTAYVLSDAAADAGVWGTPPRLSKTR